MNKCSQAISLYRVYETENKIFLITEYVEGGTLIDLIKDKELLSEDDIK